MLSMLRKRLHNDEDGFTLIELMVVVLIIAILMAIAIPAFMGAQEKAKDRSAQSDLRNGITNVRTVATDNSGKLDSLTVQDLTDAEPNIKFSASEAADTVTVVLPSGTVTAVQLYTQSASGKWFGSGTDESGEVVTCQAGKADAAPANVKTFATCKSNPTGTTLPPTTP